MRDIWPVINVGTCRYGRSKRLFVNIEQRKYIKTHSARLKKYFFFEKNQVKKTKPPVKWNRLHKHRYKAKIRHKYELPESN